MTGERILVVDDEVNIIDLTRLYLEKEGFQVEAATDGAQALEKIRDLTPALVVLDIMLPEIDGFEVCRQTRKGSDVPIIMLTARDDDIDKIVGLELGVVLAHCEERLESARQHVLGRGLILDGTCVDGRGPGLGDVFEDRLLVRGVAFNGFHEVGDQVVAALELHVDLRPRFLYTVAAADEAVVDAHHDEGDQYDEHQNAD